MSHHDAPSVDEAEASVRGILLVTAMAQDRAHAVEFFPA